MKTNLELTQLGITIDVFNQRMSCLSGLNLENLKTTANLLCNLTVK